MEVEPLRWHSPGGRPRGRSGALSHRYFLLAGRADWQGPVACLSERSYNLHRDRTETCGAQCAGRLISSFLFQMFLLVLNVTGPHTRAVGSSLAELPVRSFSPAPPTLRKGEGEETIYVEGRAGPGRGALGQARTGPARCRGRKSSEGRAGPPRGAAGRARRGPPRGAAAPKEVRR